MVLQTVVVVLQIDWWKLSSFVLKDPPAEHVLMLFASIETHGGEEEEADTKLRLSMLGLSLSQFHIIVAV